MPSRFEGIDILDIRGHHDDGWCSPELAGRGVARAYAATLTATVWVKREAPNTKTVSFTFAIEGLEEEVFDVPVDRRAAMSVPLNVRPSEEVTFSLYCENRVTDSVDARDLAFMLECLSLD